MRFYLLFIFIVGFSSLAGAGQSVGESLQTLPVQSGGRVKPFDTFAREALRFIYGKTHFDKKPAVDILMSWMLLPEYWHKVEFIQIRDSVLRKSLNLSADKNLFSPFTLLNNKTFIQEINELKVRQAGKEPLSAYFKSVRKLENKLILYQAFQRGEVPGWAPQPEQGDLRTATGEKSWLTLSQLKEGAKEQKLFQKIVEAYVLAVTVVADMGRSASPDRQAPSSGGVASESAPSGSASATSASESAPSGSASAISASESAPVPAGSASATTAPLGEPIAPTATVKDRAWQDLKTAVRDFKQHLKSQYPEYKKSLSKVSWELSYNHLKPFRLAWVFYLLGFLFLFLRFLFRAKILFYSGLLVFGLAFCLQGYGLLLRSLIMGRPPVTNMYETVVWVPWVCVILGAFFWFRHKMFSAFACSSAVALFCLLLADSAPSLLDGRLEPLEAVLRSNFWLTTHVLVITMSYSAFFLAYALGNVLLFVLLRQRGVTGRGRDKVTIYARCIDRSLQVGVVLLAAGTILGGVWADYSWGRFWGWDPKEVWALISLLGYLALLHGRLIGWIKEFGLAVGSVLMFFLIVMAWYGVNYVLGYGLHSYGFGSGGVEYVAGFALLNIAYVLLIWTFRPRQ